MNIDAGISVHELLIRAEDLNHEEQFNNLIISRYNKIYDYELFENHLLQNKADLERRVLLHLEKNDLNEAIEILDQYMKEAVNCKL